MIIWKFIFTPLYKLESVEELLNHTADKGYFLNGMLFGCLYRFKKHTRKDCKYIFIYNGKANHSMLALENTLKSNYNAIPIDSGYSLLKIYKYKSVCDDKILSLKALRSSIIKNIIQGILIIKTILFLCMFASLFLTQISVFKVEGLIISFLLFAFTVSDAIGLVVQNNTCRRYEEAIKQRTSEQSKSEPAYKSKVINLIYRDEADKDFSGVLDHRTQFRHKYGRITKLYDPVKKGYKFIGWYLDKDCTGKAVKSLCKTRYKEDVFLYAKWSKH